MGSGGKEKKRVAAPTSLWCSTRKVEAQFLLQEEGKTWGVGKKKKGDHCLVDEENGLPRGKLKRESNRK